MADSKVIITVDVKRHDNRLLYSIPISVSEKQNLKTGVLVPLQQVLTNRYQLKGFSFQKFYFESPSMENLLGKQEVSLKELTSTLLSNSLSSKPKMVAILTNPEQKLTQKTTNSSNMMLIAIVIIILFAFCIYLMISPEKKICTALGCLISPVKKVGV
jgi:hypothetical protein